MVKRAPVPGWLCLALLAPLVASTAAAGAESEHPYPADANLANVKLLYGAKGDGVTDDTQAIQEAMWDHKIIYLPPGTYLVSNEIGWRRRAREGKKPEPVAFKWLLGAGPDKTIIKLKDHCENYRPDADLRAWETRAVLRTEGQGGSPNTAIDNHISNLTVDTGTGNPGAVGIEFLGNNVSSIKNVVVRNGDGRGICGIRMFRTPGPSLLRDVTVEGFRHGMFIKAAVYSITMEQVALRGQTVAGIVNEGNLLAIRRLASDNAVPAIRNLQWTPPHPKDKPAPPPNVNGQVLLIDSELRGGGGDAAAIENQCYFFGRNVAVAGYPHAVREFDGRTLAGPRIDEYSSHPALGLFDSPAGSLNLPVEETPRWESRDFEKDWVNVLDYAHLFTPIPGQKSAPAAKADPDDDEAPVEPTEGALQAVDARMDHTAAIQAAMDSGRNTVYFPQGRYNLSNTITVGGNVRRVCAMESTFMAVDSPGRHFGHAGGGAGTKGEGGGGRAPMFRFVKGNHDVVEVEYFHIRGRVGPVFQRDAVYSVQHDSPATLVFRHANLSGLRNSAGSGKVFFEDVCASGILLDHPTSFWARQLNPEGVTLRIRNNGGRVWVLGLKTENEESVIRTVGGGQTEVLGGLIYPAGGVPMHKPAFEAVDSDHWLHITFEAWRQDHGYTELVRETRGGETRVLRHDEVVKRGFGRGGRSILNAYSGRTHTTFTPTPLPISPQLTADPHDTDVPLPRNLRRSEFGLPANRPAWEHYGDGTLLVQGGMGQHEMLGVASAVVGGEIDGGAAAHAQVDGDHTVAAKLVSLSQSGGSVMARAGLFTRQSLDDGAPMVFVGLDRPHTRTKNDTSKPGYVVLHRATPDTPAQVVARLETVEPKWLGLERRGSTIHAYVGDSATDPGKPLASVTVDWHSRANHAGWLVGSLVGNRFATSMVQDLHLLDAAGKPIVDLPPAPRPDAPPAPWRSTDIGYVGFVGPGHSRHDNGVFTLTGSGWFFPKDPRQRARFVFQPLTGDLTLTARVRAFDPGDSGWAGLMIRDTPSMFRVAHAEIGRTSRGVGFYCRMNDWGGRAEPTFIDWPAGKPLWLRLTRKGQFVSGFYSEDGQRWEPLGADGKINALSPTAYAGLFTTSGVIDRAATAELDEVSITQP